MLLRRLLPWTGAALLAIRPVSAGARRLPTRTFTVADGLPQIEITCVFEDRRGYLWVGTTDGLARFDGRDFATYGVAEGLPHPVVHDILEGPDGALWIATGQGIARFDVEKPPTDGPIFREFRLSRQETSNNVLRLHLDRRGTIWAGSSTGLSILEAGHGAFRPVRLDLPRPPVPVVNVASFAESPEGDIWVGTAWGLVRILPDGRQVRYVGPPTGQPPGVRDVHVDASGRLWICWERGVTVYRPPPVSGREREIPLPLPGVPCVDLPGLSPPEGRACGFSEADGLADAWCSVHESRQGQVRIFSERGLWLAASSGLKRDETVARFASAELSCVLEDHHGSLWIGTATGGLVRIAQTGASSYTTDDGLLVNRISSVFEGGDGELYVTTTGGAIHRFEGERFVGVTPRLPPHIADRGWGWGQIAFRNGFGEWWYATGRGLARYPAVARLEDLARTLPRNVYTNRDGLPADDVFRIFEDSRGDVWVSVLDASLPGTERLTRWDRRSDRMVPCPPAFPDNVATAFAEDGSGNVWIGFYLGGLARYRGGRFDLFPPGGPVPRGFVRQILRDSRGRLWVATSQEGIVRIDEPEADRPSFKPYRRRHGLSSDRVSALAEDAEGRLWVGTSRGVDRIDPDGTRIRPFTAAEDPNSTITSAATRDRRGRLWFGTLQGLLRFDPLLNSAASPPLVYIRGLEIRGERFVLPPAGAVSLRLPDLPPDRDEILVEFGSPQLAPVEKMRFRYKLEGKGGEWTRPSIDDSVRYAGLSSGRYRLLVDAVTSDGVHSRQPASLEFRILTPVWRRWWFATAAGLCAAAILLLLHRSHLARLLEVERVRSRIAADLHDDLGTTLYRISILSELAHRRIGDAGGEAGRLISEIGDTARGLIESAGDMVWSVDPRRDDLASLAARIRGYASEILEARGVVWSLDGADGAERILLGAETRRQIYLIFKEAIRNALRHGRPSHVAMRISASDGKLDAEIRDDGDGFVPHDDAARERDPGGYGLGTMRQRAEGLGGELRVTSAPRQGTRVVIRVPLLRRA